MFHIALMSKVRGALQFVVFIILIFSHGFSWRIKPDCPETKTYEPHLYLHCVRSCIITQCGNSKTCVIKSRIQLPRTSTDTAEKMLTLADVLSLLTSFVFVQCSSASRHIALGGLFTVSGAAINARVQDQLIASAGPGRALSFCVLGMCQGYVFHSFCLGSVIVSASTVWQKVWVCHPGICVYWRPLSVEDGGRVLFGGYEDGWWGQSWP